MANLFTTGWRANNVLYDTFEAYVGVTLNYNGTINIKPAITDADDITSINNVSSRDIVSYGNVSAVGDIYCNDLYTAGD